MQVQKRAMARPAKSSAKTMAAVEPEERPLPPLWLLLLTREGCGEVGDGGEGLEMAAVVALARVSVAVILIVSSFLGLVGKGGRG